MIDRNSIYIAALIFGAFLIGFTISGCSGESTISGSPAKSEEHDYQKQEMNSNTETAASPTAASGLDRELRETGRSADRYAEINENPFLETSRAPLSTFSIDVDTASYSNVRRYINQGSLPPKDAVRIEELVNYFDYDYPQPIGGVPFSVKTEVAKTPWNSNHKIVQIGLQGKNVSLDNLPPSNLVFLLDVSGSMNEPNKLPLLKNSLRILVDQLTSKDKVAIVAYAGASGLVLPSTSASNKNEILSALNRLEAGGGTNGGEGIELAYKVARENFVAGGNNRVILATDGDFNVGLDSDEELVKLVEEKRKSNIFLSVFGFGSGNLNDSMMEKLSNKGNGNYAYIDSNQEARKALGNQIAGTLYTIAKDVKIQVEFNPAKVAGYRLIGYENRVLADRDFNDDKKDAGEIGAGISVTALYEIVPFGGKIENPGIDELKYSKVTPSGSNFNDELMTVKLRYKEPRDEKSKLLSIGVLDRDQPIESASNNLKFAAAVAQFGLILRDSRYKGTSTFQNVSALASAAKGNDLKNYRSDFLVLVEKASNLKTRS
ncbi:MAG: VWA domain-containing protein [Acidobacteria bacterium]|nr:VWA domain-containing protein [Acidobacteriota bacterium]